MRRCRLPALSTPANNGQEVTVFSRRSGSPGTPALVCVHGFPTSSIDYSALADELHSEFDIYTVDFPGYGLSDKPPKGYDTATLAGLLYETVEDVRRYIVFDSVDQLVEQMNRDVEDAKRIAESAR